MNELEDSGPSSQLRPLELEASALGGGFHDGLRTYLSLRAADLTMVASHEGIHAWAFSVTTDGGLLQTALMRARAEAPSESAERFEFVASELLRTGRTAHECVATYVSIAAATAVKPSLGNEWLDELT